VVTVGLAFLVFSERLAPVQLLGGALVLTAVVVLNARRRRVNPLVGSIRSVQADPQRL
jgi:drug/metabolite transporter (DMT)-like permease